MVTELTMLGVILAGLALSRVMLWRNPVIGQRQIFAAGVTWIGGVLVVARGSNTIWHYTALVLAVAAALFLLTAFWRNRAARPA
jgi:hypothetical protein